MWNYSRDISSPSRALNVSPVFDLETMASTESRQYFGVAQAVTRLINPAGRRWPDPCRSF
jgi:hypothetical protein